MKITIDVDCSADEAREFLGLPDVKPMQDAMMQEIQDRMMTSLQSMQPEMLMKTWLPAQTQGLEQLQSFWSQFMKDGKNPGS